jgi:hypothetical protein
MGVLNSNADALLIGFPMIVLLFVCVFKIDELFGKSKQKRITRALSRPLSGGFDRLSGQPIGIDPDGTPLGDPGSNGNGNAELIRPMHAPARYRSRVSFQITGD